MHVKPLRQSVDPVCLSLQRFKDLRIPMESPFNLVLGKNILPYEIVFLLIQDHPHGDDLVCKEAGPARALVEVHHLKVLRQELDLRETVPG